MNNDEEPYNDGTYAELFSNILNSVFFFKYLEESGSGLWFPFKIYRSVWASQNVLLKTYVLLT